MRLLVLGGTSFLGRHFVRAALDAGHDVSTFTRGRTNPGLHPEAESLVGDRDGDIGDIARRNWNAVLDTSGYLPRVVRASAQALAGAVVQYTFVSSESVYAPGRGEPLDETCDVVEPPPEGVEDVMAHYGGLKVGCEREGQTIFGERALVVRPGLIIGPYDPTNRFTYWVRRMHDAADGEEVLAPAPASRRVQFIDARDLAAWLLLMIEAGEGGVFNADRPASPITMGETLEACAAAAGRSPRVVWADERFILQQGIEPWMGLPLWIPEDDPEGFGPFDNRKAIAAGLSFRPLRESASETLAWDLSRETMDPISAGGMWAGIDRKLERKVLSAWRSRRSGES